MASPFRNSKKARKRYRKKAERESAWADQHEVVGTKQPWSIDGMRWLAALNLSLAKARRIKRLTNLK